MAECGAKTRKGTPCPSKAMPNGRCRMHGGTNPGAPRGNQNRRIHGFYSKALREEDMDLYEAVEIGKLDHEIKLARVLLFKAMALAAKIDDAPMDAANQAGFALTEIHRKGTGKAVTVETTARRVNIDERIDRLMSRISSLERARQELINGQAGKDASEVAEEIRRALDLIDGGVPKKPESNHD